MMFQFNNLGDFLMMSGHGPYVWACYLITIAALILIAVIPIFHKKNIAKQIRRQARIEEANRETVRRGE